MRVIRADAIHSQHKTWRGGRSHLGTIRAMQTLSLLLFWTRAAHRYASVRSCLHVFVRERPCARAPVHSQHSCRRDLIDREFMCAFVHFSVRPCARAPVRPCEPASVRPSVRPCVCASMYPCVGVSLRLCPLDCVHAPMHAPVPSCADSSMRPCAPAAVHPYACSWFSRDLVLVAPLNLFGSCSRGVSGPGALSLH